jgi:hypothetical protein
MNNFNIGDRVKCIDDVHSAHMLQKGKIYTVKSQYVTDNNICVYLKEIKGFSNYFFESRFVIYCLEKKLNRIL